MKRGAAKMPCEWWRRSLVNGGAYSAGARSAGPNYIILYNERLVVSVQYVCASWRNTALGPI